MSCECSKGPQVIGMCGRSGTGKSTVCGELLRWGVMSVDTDKVYRALTAPQNGEPSDLVKRIAREFGSQAVTPTGELDRAYISSLVFGKGGEGRLLLLNRLTHGAILEETERLIGYHISNGAVGVVVDAPALFESGFDKRCDATVCVTAPEEVSVRRICARDGITETEARRRLSSQVPEEELCRRCDLTVENGGDSDPHTAALAIYETFIKNKTGNSCK